MSKQAYYQHQSREYLRHACYDIILEVVSRIRCELPRMGGCKLYSELLKHLPHDLHIGRDALFNLLRLHGLLLRRRHGDVPHTTDSNHRFHIYKNLITDAYSHKIVGWSLQDTLETQGPLKALSGLPSESGLIHHSDRGTQYCCAEYVGRLQKNGITISMTESGNPRENAIAERLNGILKMEWFYDMEFTTLECSSREIGKVIELYNNKRPHSSIGMHTPEEIHLNPVATERKWKNYYKKKEVEEIQKPKNV